VRQLSLDKPSQQLSNGKDYVRILIFFAKQIVYHTGLERQNSCFTVMRFRLRIVEPFLLMLKFLYNGNAGAE
jgi:hypothetical protein